MAQVNYKSFFVTTVRLAFAGLFLFEAANAVGLLHFSLDFTWFGLILPLVVVVVLLETSASWLARRGMALHWSAWLLALLIILNDAIGDIGHLYAPFIWYDQAGHLLGGLLGVFVILLVLVVVERRQMWIHPAWVNPALAFGAVSALSAT